jgi:protein arginine N-methyltransferase 1
MARSYDLFEHGLLVGDERRMKAYLDAIHRAVRPGAVVADIGCGTGVFTLAACDAGARRVFAIEASPIVQVARAIVAANGYSARVEFIRALSTNTTLPERADVIVMDVHGVLPDEQIAVAIDARQRLLSPGGILIPAVEAIWAAPVEAPEAYDRHAGVAPDEDGIDLGAAQEWAFRQSSRWRVQPAQLVSEPRLCATITYTTIEDADIRVRLDWTASRPAIVHGIVAWFESVMYENVTLSNRPGDAEVIYAQRFFPRARPLTVVAGQRLHADFRGESRDDGYEWRCILDA